MLPFGWEGDVEEECADGGGRGRNVRIRIGEPREGYGVDVAGGVSVQRWLWIVGVSDSSSESLSESEDIEVSESESEAFEEVFGGERGVLSSWPERTQVVMTPERVPMARTRESCEKVALQIVEGYELRVGEEGLEVGASFVIAEWMVNLFFGAERWRSLHTMMVLSRRMA